MTLNRIWRFPQRTTDHGVLAFAYHQELCPSCHVRIACADRASEGDGRAVSRNDQVLVCPTCGWWGAFSTLVDSSCGWVPNEAFLHVRGAGAALERFGDFPDDETLLLLTREVDRHLCSGGTSRQWAALEDATVAVLRAFGYQVRATARSKDDGVDAVLDHATHGQVFVQVKHSRNKVGVSAFRELVGTMCLGGARVGLLVTSSRFTRGAEELSNRGEAAGVRIELVDGERFLAALRLTTRSALPTWSEVVSMAELDTTIVGRSLQL